MCRHWCTWLLLITESNYGIIDLSYFCGLSISQKTSQTENESESSDQSSDKEQLLVAPKVRLWHSISLAVPTWIIARQRCSAGILLLGIAFHVPFGLALLHTQLYARLGARVRRFVQTGCYIVGASSLHQPSRDHLGGNTRVSTHGKTHMMSSRIWQAQTGAFLAKEGGWFSGWASLPTLVFHWPEERQTGAWLLTFTCSFWGSVVCGQVANQDSRADPFFKVTEALIHQGRKGAFFFIIEMVPGQNHKVSCTETGNSGSADQSDYEQWVAYLSEHAPMWQVSTHLVNTNKYLPQNRQRLYTLGRNICHRMPMPRWPTICHNHKAAKTIQDQWRDILHPGLDHCREGYLTLQQKLNLKLALASLANVNLIVF